jgi:DNA repair ATPase RecN
MATILCPLLSRFGHLFEACELAEEALCNDPLNGSLVALLYQLFMNKHENDRAENLLARYRNTLLDYDYSGKEIEAELSRVLTENSSLPPRAQSVQKNLTRIQNPGRVKQVL